MRLFLKTLFLSPTLTVRLENRIYLLGIFLLLSGALWLRTLLPAIPLLNNDSWNYIQPAFSLLATGIEQPTYRGFLYPSFLTFILTLSPHLSAIVWAQHLAGLLAAILLIFSWERMRVFLPQGVGMRRGHRICGWIMLWVYGFSSASIVYEQSIRPEALLPLNAILCIAFATEFTRTAFFCTSSRQTAISAICTFFLIIFSIAAYYLKPAWGITSLTALAPIAAALWSRCLRWTTLLVPLILGLCIAFFLFEFPERQAHKKIPGNDLFLPETLFCSSGEIIFPLIKADITRTDLHPHYELASLLLPHIEAAILHPRQIPFGYRFLPPDDLLYGGTMGALEDFFQGDSQKVAAVCYSYYRRAWRENPWGMLRKIIGQFAYFYCPWKSINYQQAQDFQLHRHVLKSLEALRNHPSFAWKPYEEYLAQLKYLATCHLNLRLPSPFVTLATLLNPLYAPLVFLAALAAGAVLWTRPYLPTRFLSLRPTALWCLYLLSYNFAMTFTIAVVHMMTVDRYHFVQTIFSLLAECFSALFLIQFFYFFKKRKTDG